MRRKKKFLLEKDIQEPCVKWARKQGWWARKFSSPANRSVPDYLFAKDGVKIAVEFKAPKKEPTEAQAEEIAAMKYAGWSVYVIDDIERFKSVLIAVNIGWLE